MTDFIKYLTGLAQDGETMLFVKQKPKKSGDGYVYLPHLPENMAGENAWYGNTGVYVLDRFKDGKLSASSANIEYVACMILDDVGTKSLTPPVAPTWIMETSPGNYQYGYGYYEQPTKAVYEATIKAVAAAGFSDPGATNAVRNFRIPGSINLKPGRDGFKARLVEFHPDREFTNEYLVEKFGVTPGEASKGMVPIRLADDGNDDVLAWLDENNLVLEGINAEGWVGVICPNHANHSDGKPMGRYNPVTRSYMCFHGHCKDMISATFLAWVAEQGGPEHTAGLRDDLLASLMREVYANLDAEAPTIFSDNSTAEAIIADSEMRERERVQRDELVKVFAYVVSDDSYFDIEYRREYRRKGFDAMYAHLDTNSKFKTMPRIGAGKWFDENRQPMKGALLMGITYAPGASALCARDGARYGNKWRDGRPASVPGDVGPFLALLERIVADEAEREHILNVFAFKRQHPETKINHAILLIGQPGIGKDSIYAPFIWAIGGAFHRNVHIIKEGAELVSDFGYALENEIIVLNELRQTEGRDRRALENSLKPIIAAPPEFLSVNRKNAHPYDALNRILVLAGSNHDVPIALPSDDRRWFVVKSSAAPLSSAEAKQLWRYYHAGGFGAFAAYLDQRDVSAFDPGARPPMTEAKACMIEQGHSNAESYLLDMIRKGEREFSRGVVAGPWHAVLDTLQAGLPNSVKLYAGALFHALREAGWVDLGLVHASGLSTKRHIYASPAMAAMHTKTELRRMVEEPMTPTGGLKAVK